MSIKKPALPDTPKPNGTPGERFEFDSRVRETLEVITGRRAGKITPLADGASNAEIISKVNEIIARLM